MTIRRELIDELLKDYETPQDILAEGGLLKELTKAVIERCLETELDTHLGYPKYARKGSALGNMRNGQRQKTLKGEQGHVDIEVPRDRQGTFEPQLVKKGQTRLEGFDDKILRVRLPDCLRRLPDGPCAREPARAQQSALSRVGRQPGGTEGTAGDVARANRRSQILVVGAHRTAKPRRERSLDCLCRWAHRLTRSL
jgi:Transposase, Mutator family